MHCPGVSKAVRWKYEVTGGGSWLGGRITLRSKRVGVIVIGIVMLQIYVLNELNEHLKKSRLGHGFVFLFSVVCCQVEVYVTGWSLVQRSPTECHVSKKCNREASITEATLAPTGCRAIDK